MTVWKVVYNCDSCVGCLSTQVKLSQHTVTNVEGHQETKPILAFTGRVGALLTELWGNTVLAVSSWRYLRFGHV